MRLKQYQHLKEEDIPYKYRDHAWFACFAPASNPEIVVVVLVEHGLHGGSAAAPIASKILTKYFNKKMGKEEGSPANSSDLFSVKALEETDAPGDTDNNENNEQEAPPEQNGSGN